MPELPEVEATLHGLAPHLTGQRISGAVVRNPQLRWPVPAQLPAILSEQTIRALRRRAKYLQIECDGGTLILHLGMSGSLLLLPQRTPPNKHDHFDLLLSNGKLVRLHDPRRFGAVLWQARGAPPHPLLAQLGPEPLQNDFDAGYLYRMTRKRSATIKQIIMDSKVVAGIGNIYASEALFRCGIRPQRQAGRLTRAHCANLVQAIRDTLTEAIALGGSSLRNFVGSDGKPGHFQQHHWVYGRSGLPCRICGEPIKLLRQGQRSSFYCPSCQK